VSLLYYGTEIAEPLNDDRKDLCLLGHELKNNIAIKQDFIVTNF